ncbi:helix-turn-helix domain-containing protein [Anaerosalibacter massiliensis]|uniref:helix-turn-helix domain-containing protein n=1 Tax=Anaerosalibacter massiliensis TaxID=1347392 RepID=UPI0006786E56|nr:helix-turn-helix transcriptional regulator [Anaerosalibacter massiliensis]
MIKFNLDEILKKQGKTMYWLSKQTGISQNSISKIVKNETAGINFDTLEKICLALDVDIEDILKIVK